MVRRLCDAKGLPSTMGPIAFMLPRPAWRTSAPELPQVAGTHSGGTFVRPLNRYPPSDGRRAKKHQRRPSATGAETCSMRVAVYGPVARNRRASSWGFLRHVGSPCKGASLRGRVWTSVVPTQNTASYTEHRFVIPWRLALNAKVHSNSGNTVVPGVNPVSAPTARRSSLHGSSHW